VLAGNAEPKKKWKITNGFSIQRFERKNHLECPLVSLSHRNPPISGGGQGVLGGNRRMEFPFIILKDDRKILAGVDQAVRCYRFDIRVDKSVFEEQECHLESVCAIRWI